MQIDSLWCQNMANSIDAFDKPLQLHAIRDQRHFPSFLRIVNTNLGSQTTHKNIIPLWNPVLF